MKISSRNGKRKKKKSLFNASLSGRKRDLHSLNFSDPDFVFDFFSPFTSPSSFTELSGVYLCLFHEVRSHEEKKLLSNSIQLPTH